MIVLVPLWFSTGRLDLNLWVNKNLSSQRANKTLLVDSSGVFILPQPQLTTDGYSVFVNYWELINSIIGS